MGSLNTMLLGIIFRLWVLLDTHSQSLLPEYRINFFYLVGSSYYAGMENPISGGEIRDKKDQYRGVGISMNDPFESYRKSKGQAFVERMRQRAEERP